MSDSGNLIKYTNNHQVGIYKNSRKWRCRSQSWHMSYDYILTLRKNIKFLQMRMSAVTHVLLLLLGPGKISEAGIVGDNLGIVSVVLNSNQAPCFRCAKTSLTEDELLFLHILFPLVSIYLYGLPGIAFFGVHNSRDLFKKGA